jgi:twitching motility protein PilT
MLEAAHHSHSSTRRDVDPVNIDAVYNSSDLLTLAVTQGASDLHVRAGKPPAFRLNGALIYVNGPAMTDRDVFDFLLSIAGEHKTATVREKGSCDFAIRFAIPPSDSHNETTANFRVVAMKEQGRFAVTLRSIPTNIKPLTDYPPVLQELISLKRGLVLVTGPTGSGKTTTLASMINYANTTLDNRHVYTIEDPIEFVYVSRNALFTQREVGTDCISFADGLRTALRSDPNIILIGEMRDLETMRTALHAAETGHLVLATLHTENAIKSVDRICGSFPAEEQPLVRQQLSTVLKAVVTQQLIPTSDQVGRIPAFEILINNAAIAANIRDNKLSAVASYMQTGKKEGMVLMDDYLASLVRAQRVDSDIAVTFAHDKRGFKERLN